MPEAVKRKALAQGLQKLNENMVTMAELSELAIRKAVDNLAQPNPTVLDEILALDPEIYGLQLEIERTCTDLIALHAPVARDLRVITTSLKITTDLDRIGRYAKDIAVASLPLAERRVGRLEDLGGLLRMGELAIRMVDRSIEAFVRRDAESVRNLIDADDEVDDLHETVFRDVVRRMAEGQLPVDLGTHYVLVNRYLERIADHAVNIGERVVYMVTGERPARMDRIARRQARWRGNPP